MKLTFASLTALLACAILISAFKPAELASHTWPAGPQNNDLRATVVRAEYFREGGNRYLYDTVCHITNVSESQPITLGNVSILDASGNVTATFSGLAGAILPSFGKVRLPIDNSILGLARQGGIAPRGMSVLVRWRGRARSLKLTADIERYPSGNVQDRGLVSVQGYDVIQ